MKVVIAGSCYRPTFQDWANEMKAEFPDIEFVPAETEKEQKTAIRDADVYFGIPPSAVFKAATKLKWVHTSATGINGVASNASFRTAEAYEGRRRLFKNYLRHFIDHEPFPYVCDKRAGF